jgi:hypothetical protein
LEQGRIRPKTILILAVALVASTALTAVLAASYPWSLGPKQPIPFSHRVHAGTKQIGCLFCHPGALKTPVPGLPPLETCMLCHSRIIIHYPEIEKVRRHYVEKDPIWWVRVTSIPDYAHFDHSMHLAAGFDCSRCHGDVKAMDRIVLPQKIIMGFCINCHRKEGASHDCFVCHY